MLNHTGETCCAHQHCGVDKLFAASAYTVSRFRIMLSQKGLMSPELVSEIVHQVTGSCVRKTPLFLLTSGSTSRDTTWRLAACFP